uniref:Uncharacterized protein n=1 Tax=Siphoviridae sp. ctOCb13 TaxID=2825477 RepID=A0A8S5Q0E6_9CAUD|nr:MAG TPA: hypothetical protein [Siphoviridae sp. ctOCb13]
MAEYKDAVLRHQESRSRISEATPNRSAATDRYYDLPKRLPLAFCKGLASIAPEDHL